MQVIKEQGRVDILVNNAGFGTTSLLAEHDAEDARTVCVVCSAYEPHAVMAVETCKPRKELLGPAGPPAAENPGVRQRRRIGHGAVFNGYR